MTFVIGATSGVLLLLLVAPLAQALAAVVDGTQIDPWSHQRSLSGLVTAAVLVVATWVGTRWAAPWVGFLSSGVAGLWALTSAAEMVLQSGGSVQAALSVGFGASAVAAGVMRLLTRRAIPLLAASVVLLVAASTVLVGTSIGADVGVMVRVVALLAVLSVGVMPRVSIAVGGLSSADYRIRNSGRMSDSALSARLQESSGLLLGALYGVSVLVAAVGFWLGAATGCVGTRPLGRAAQREPGRRAAPRSRVFEPDRLHVPVAAGVPRGAARGTAPARR